MNETSVLLSGLVHGFDSYLPCATTPYLFPQCHCLLAAVGLLPDRITTAGRPCLPQAAGMPAGIKAVYSNCVPAVSAATILQRMQAACPSLRYMPAEAGSEQQARPKRSARVWLLHQASQSQHVISFDRHGTG